MHRRLEINLVNGKNLFPPKSKIRSVHCVFECGSKTVLSCKKSSHSPTWSDIFVIETDGTELNMNVICTTQSGEELVYGSKFVDFDYSVELKDSKSLAYFDEPLQNSINEKSRITFILNVECFSSDIPTPEALEIPPSQVRSPNRIDSPLELDEESLLDTHKRISTLGTYVKSRKLGESEQAELRRKISETTLEEEETFGNQDSVHRTKVANLKVNFGSYSGYVTTIFDRGNQVQVPDGAGKMIFPNELSYEGNWRRGMKHGYGILDNGKRKVKGLWRNNKPDGQFEIRYPNYDFYRGPIRILPISRKKGKKQKGGERRNEQINSFTLKQIVRHGTGAFYNNKSAHYFFGNFVNDSEEGFGIELSLKRGAKYSGYWKNGSKWGKGVLTKSNGSLFFGNFKNNQRVKGGKFYLSNGYRIECQFGNSGRMEKVKLEEGDFRSCPTNVLKLVENDIKRNLIREENVYQKNSTRMREKYLWQAMMNDGEKIMDDLKTAIPTGVHYDDMDMEKIMLKILARKKSGLVSILQFFCSYFKKTYSWLLQFNDNANKRTRRAIKFQSCLLLAKEDLSSFLAYLERTFSTHLSKLLDTDSKGSKKPMFRGSMKKRSGSVGWKNKLGNINALSRSPEGILTSLSSNMMIEDVVERFRIAFNFQVNGYVHQRLYDTLFRVYCQEFKEKEILLKQKIYTIRHSLTSFNTENKVKFLEFRLDEIRSKLVKYHHEYFEIIGCRALLDTINRSNEDDDDEEEEEEKKKKMDLEDYFSTYYRSIRGPGEKKKENVVQSFDPKEKMELLSKESIFLIHCVSSLIIKIEQLEQKYPEMGERISRFSPQIYHDRIQQRTECANEEVFAKINQSSDFIKGEFVSRDSEWLKRYFEEKRLEKLEKLESDLRVHQMGLICVFRRRELNLLEEMFRLIQLDFKKEEKQYQHFRVNMGDEYVVISKKIPPLLDFQSQLKSFNLSYRFVEESIIPMKNYITKMYKEDLKSTNPELRNQCELFRNLEYFRSQFMSLYTTFQSLELGMNYFSLGSVGKIQQTKKSCQIRIRSIVVKLMFIKSNLERELLVVDQKDIRSEIDLDLEEFTFDEEELEGEEEEEEEEEEKKKDGEKKRKDVIPILDKLIDLLVHKCDVGRIDIILKTSEEIDILIRKFISEFPEHQYLYTRWKTVYEHQKVQYIFSKNHDLQFDNLQTQIQSAKEEVNRLIYEITNFEGPEFQDEIIPQKSKSNPPCLFKHLLDSFFYMLDSIEKDMKKKRKKGHQKRTRRRQTKEIEEEETDTRNSKKTRNFTTLADLFISGIFSQRVSTIVRLLDQLLNGSLQKRSEKRIEKNDNFLNDILDVYFLFFQYCEDCYLTFKRVFFQFPEINDCFSRIHSGLELLYDLEMKKQKNNSKNEDENIYTKELEYFYELIDEGNLILLDYGKIYSNNDRKKRELLRSANRRKRSLIIRGLFFRSLRLTESCVCLLEGVRSLILSIEYYDINSQFFSHSHHQTTTQVQNHTFLSDKKYRLEFLQLLEKMLHDAFVLQKEKKVRTVERYLDTVLFSSKSGNEMLLPLQLLGVGEKFVPKSRSLSASLLAKGLSSSINSARGSSLKHIPTPYEKSIKLLNRLAEKVRPEEKLLVLHKFDISVSEEMKDVSKKLILEEDDILPVVLFIVMQSNLKHYAEYNYILDWMDPTKKTKMIARYEIFFKYIETLDPYARSSKGELLSVMGNLLQPLEHSIQELISEKKMSSVTWIVNLFNFIYCEIGRRVVTAGYYSVLEIDQIALRNSILENRNNVAVLCTKDTVGFQVLSRHAYEDKIVIQFFNVYSPNIYKFLSEQILKTFQGILE